MYQNAFLCLIIKLFIAHKKSNVHHFQTYIAFLLTNLNFKGV